MFIATMTTHFSDPKVSLALQGGNGLKKKIDAWNLENVEQC